MDHAYRPLTAADLELLMAWRSHPVIYQGFYIQDGPLAWAEHREWFRSRPDTRRDWIIQVRDEDRWRDVGSVNLTGLDGDAPEVGVLVGEVTAHGQGIGRHAVGWAVGWLRDREYPGASARILDRNAASRRVFEAVGFERVGDARDGESAYRLTFSGPSPGSAAAQLGEFPGGR